MRRGFKAEAERTAEAIRAEMGKRASDRVGEADHHTREFYFVGRALLFAHRVAVSNAFDHLLAQGAWGSVVRAYVDS